MEVEVVEVGLPDDASILVMAQRVGPAAKDGPTNVGLDDIPGFASVAKALRGISKEVHEAVSAVRPDTIEVEFGLDLAVKGSRLLAVLVDAGTSASMKVRLSWQPGGEDGRRGDE